MVPWVKLLRDNLLSKLGVWHSRCFVNKLDKKITFGLNFFGIKLVICVNLSKFAIKN